MAIPFVLPEPLQPKIFTNFCLINIQISHRLHCLHLCLAWRTGHWWKRKRDISTGNNLASWLVPRKTVPLTIHNVRGLSFADSRAPELFYKKAVLRNVTVCFQKHIFWRTSENECTNLDFLSCKIGTVSFPFTNFNTKLYSSSLHECEWFHIEAVTRRSSIKRCMHVFLKIYC